ncbi:MAG: DegV family protein [Bacilli bacterium]
MKNRIVVDSTFRLSPEYVSEHNLEVVPLNVIIDNKTYTDEVDIDLGAVLRAIDESHKVSTSQPSPDAFVKAFNKMAEEGATDILCITIASTLSGTFNSAQLASKEIFKVNIHLFDSLSTSIGGEMLVKILVEQVELGKTIPEAIDYCLPFRANSVILMAMENLDAIRKSGRLSRIKATIGNLLRVKPVIEFIHGKNHVNNKFRTEKAIVDFIIERIKVDLKNVKNRFIIAISHVQALEKIEKIKKTIETEIKGIDIHLSLETSPVVAINLGYGGFGIGWCHD